jgi:histone H3/H4
MHYFHLPLCSRKILRDNVKGISKPSIKRLARKGGVKRIQLEIYDEVRSTMKMKLQQVSTICVQRRCLTDSSDYQTPCVAGW